MALLINDNCTACDACKPVCPNEAISVGDPIYVIDPLRCTECVGAEDEPQCKLVCPADCIVQNPDSSRVARRTDGQVREPALSPRARARLRGALRLAKGEPHACGETLSVDEGQDLRLGPRLTKARRPTRRGADSAPTARRLIRSRPLQRRYSSNTKVDSW